MTRSTTHHFDGCLPGHRHAQAHVSVVLRGDYLESSIDGRFRCDSDCVITHPQYHWHENHFRGCQVAVTNLSCEQSGDYGVFKLLGSARRSVLTLGHMDVLAEVISDPRYRVLALPNPAWVDAVREVLLDEPWTRLESLARSVGISAAHLSRRFYKITGLRPVQFRAESRARLAVRRIRLGGSLTQAALDSGYADQSHMCRDLRVRIGHSPAALAAG